MAGDKSLTVWLAGEPVGHVRRSARNRLRFGYAPEVIDRWPSNTPLLSCSLPVRAGQHQGRPFFAGLLPEGEHRRALAERAGCLPADVFALLEAFGRDVAGAVSVGDHYLRDAAAVVPYIEAALDAEVARLAANPLGLHDDSELSIAGFQDKLLLVALPGGGWGRPAHGHPSTHILKVDDRFHPGLVLAEHDCLRIAQSAGLSAADSSVERVAGLDCLIVRRFDRASDVGFQRLHMEDSCQALGIDLEASQGRGKYEPSAGLSLRSVATQLDAWALDPEEELCRLLDHIVFTVAIGNADDHGKNISLMHVRPGVIQLAPLYDTVPTMMWSNLRTRAALSIGGAVDLPVVTVTDITAEARTWGVAESVARPRINAVLERILEASESIAPSGEIDTSTFVADRARGLLVGG